MIVFHLWGRCFVDPDQIYFDYLLAATPEKRGSRLSSFQVTVGPRNRYAWKIFSLLLLLFFAPAAFSTTVTKPTQIAINAASGACPQTSGPLTLRVSSPRSTGISPFLVFYDATATTDTSITGNTTVFQDVSFTWNFGDGGTSGTSKWAYGSNAGNNSRNTATGGIAAHLYITAGSDTNYTATVTATDGTNTVTCTTPVTAYDPAGSKGFPRTATTCVAAATTPVAGSGGCPSGAAVLRTSSYTRALGASHLANGKRVLFKCGDTFTGNSAPISATKWSIGAYGGCENTPTNRPIMSSTGTSYQFSLTGDVTNGDGRIADIDFEGNGTSGGAVIGPGTPHIIYQITLNNLYSNGNPWSYAWPQGAQMALIGSVMTGMASNIGTYFNYEGIQPANWTGNVFNNLFYQALIGNSLNGTGAPNGGAGIETWRCSACSYLVAENNTIQNANNGGPVFKLQQSNTPADAFTWAGVYDQYDYIADNLFQGLSGAQLVETAPQNDMFDERLRYIVVERNMFVPNNGTGEALMVSAQYETVRNNVFFVPSGQASPDFNLVHIGTRGSPANGCTGCAGYPTQYVQAYNNTCYLLSTRSGQGCIVLSGSVPMSGAPVNSIVKNNLMYDTFSGAAAVVDNGTMSTVSNNTTTPSNDPRIANRSGTFLLISDYKPTANYSGAVFVPNFSDAVGAAWQPSWNLGAVHR
jgi:hypothetical protein